MEPEEAVERVFPEEHRVVGGYVPTSPEVLASARSCRVADLFPVAEMLRKPIAYQKADVFAPPPPAPTRWAVWQRHAMYQIHRGRRWLALRLAPELVVEHRAWWDEEL